MEIKQSKEFYYRIQKGDNFNNICDKFSTSKENILRNNKDLAFYVGEWVCIKQNEFKTHIVKPTETLKEIANQYNTKIEDILSTNNLICEKLYIGQILKIY